MQMGRKRDKRRDGIERGEEKKEKRIEKSEECLEKGSYTSFCASRATSHHHSLLVVSWKRSQRNPVGHNMAAELIHRARSDGGVPMWQMRCGSVQKGSGVGPQAV